jgi:predicted RNA-binding protein with PIN domain
MERWRSTERCEAAGAIADWGRFFRGVLESLAIAAGFVAAGLAWAAVESDLERRDEPLPAVYATQPMTASEPSIWLVDGYNVLHAGVLGGRDRSRWWTESRRQELLDRVAGFDAEADLWIVFDGPVDPEEPSDRPGLRCVFASSADDWLIERVRRADDPSRIAVVTSDRQVAGRARNRGAQIVSPMDFLSRCAS